MRVRQINESDISKIESNIMKDQNPIVKKMSGDIKKSSLSGLKEDMDILQDFIPSNEEVFNIDIMDKMVFGEPHLNNPDPILKVKYNEALVKADLLFGYHQNEDILNYLYLEYVLQDDNLKKKYIQLMKKYNGGKKTKFDKNNDKKKLEEPFIKETTDSSSSGQYSSPAFVAGSQWKNAKDPMFDGGNIIEPNKNNHDAGVNSFKIIKENLNMEDYILNPQFGENFLNKLNEDMKPKSLILKDELGKENESNFKSDMKDYSPEIVKAVGSETKVNGNPTVIEPEYNEDEPLPIVDEKEQERRDNIEKEIMLNRGMGLEDVKFDIEPSQQYLDRMKEMMGDQKWEERQEKAKYRAKAPMYNKDAQPVKIVKEDVNLSAFFINSKGNREFVEFKYNDIKTVDRIDESYTKIEIGGSGCNSVNLINEENNNYSFYTDSKGSFYKCKKATLTEGEGFDKMKHLFKYNPKSFLKGRK